MGRAGKRAALFLLCLMTTTCQGEESTCPGRRNTLERTGTRGKDTPFFLWLWKPPLPLGVFQRWLGGSVDFFRKWADYQKGFGSELSELWLGNDHLHLLTALGENELRVDLTDFANRHSFAKYGSFQVAAESDRYRLTLGNFTGGSAGDSLSYHNHMPFSTPGRKPDTQNFSCAEMYKGAWWYNECHYSNLNGRYWLGEHNSYADGINWKTGKGYKYSYKRTEMKIRAVA